MQRHHAGAVGGGVVGVFMGLHEQPGHAYRHGGAGKIRHEFALTTRRAAKPARLLHAVGGVEDHRVAGGCHYRQGTHVVYQRVVAEGDAALGEQDVGVAEGFHLLRHVLHVPWRQELAFLYIHHPARAGGGGEQIGLAAQEGGDLQHIHHLARDGALLLVMHVGEHRHAEALADFGEHR